MNISYACQEETCDRTFELMVHCIIFDSSHTLEYCFYLAFKFKVTRKSLLDLSLIVMLPVAGYNVTVVKENVKRIGLQHVDRHHK